MRSGRTGNFEFFRKFSDIFNRNRLFFVVGAFDYSERNTIKGTTCDLFNRLFFSFLPVKTSLVRFPAQQSEMGNLTKTSLFGWAAGHFLFPLWPGSCAPVIFSEKGAI